MLFSKKKLFVFKHVEIGQILMGYKPILSDWVTYYVIAGNQTTQVLWHYTLVLRKCNTYSYSTIY